MNKDSLDSPASLQRAPPVGRALRLLFGLALTGYVALVYFRIDRPVAIRTLLLVFALIGVYSLIHFVASRSIAAFGRGLLAGVAWGLLVAVYIAGAPRGPILGHGEGALAAFTFLAISLVAAGVRADPGCEVMAIPNILLRKQAALACLVFSPLDRSERRLRSKRAI